MGVFSENGDCDVMGKSKGPMEGVLTCYDITFILFIQFIQCYIGI